MAATRTTLICIRIAKAAGLLDGTEKHGDVYFNTSYDRDGNQSLRINVDNDSWFDEVLYSTGNSASLRHRFEVVA